MSRLRRAKSDEKSDVFVGSGCDVPSTRMQRHPDRNERRRALFHHYRASSGYESFPDSEDLIRQSSTQNDQRQVSPPPPYETLASSQFVKLPSNDSGYISDSRNHTSEPGSQLHTKSEQSFSTKIELPEEVSQVKFVGRDKDTNAPDMIVNRHPRANDSFIEVKVDGESVDYTTMPLATRKEAKDLLVKYARTKFRYRNDIAEKCVITGSEVIAPFRYLLTTQRECREFVEKTKPYRGQTVESFRSKSLSPWDYDAIDRPKHFSIETKCFPLPNTEKVGTCTMCNRAGKTKCSECIGSGTKQCDRCHGHCVEPTTRRSCMQCNDGRETCYKCSGNGVRPCANCSGNGSVVTHTELKVTWKISRSVYMDETDDISDKLLNRVSGSEVLCQDDEQLEPINRAALLHEKIRQCSKYYLEEHRHAVGRVVRQKQTVEVVPIQEMDCRYKDTAFRFYLVGRERLVHVPHFPKERLSFLSRVFS